ncbi:beta-galactosidase [Solirubrobacter ginsenosidimutans]|uniref:beta-galactosidase n=1 Tax=Solirubrobacter ginsenosidimutans TaxID=490573 RepID=A0A9X3S0G7_9ACTN|nr:beta-galactosidase [Solirubrobacter ginsenosidimutans]MDA0160067.1 beta-galactosidase [Solirubrobacter ginsenosidimutans]
MANPDHEGDVGPQVAQREQRLSGLPQQVLYGVAYYAEYQPYDRLERDLDLMAAAELTVIRVGESVWSTWEPEDGRFELEWLHPVLDGAHARGIKVILGTPTYAMPPWLVRKYPEVTAERKTGVRIPYGHRQDGDYSNAAFRHYADRITRKVAGRYAPHPAVIGFQVDNEPGMELFHNRAAFQGFVDRLRHTYDDDPQRLNREWGLVYWSHRIARWDELWPPDGNTVPSYDLAWRRYQSQLTTDFIAAQAEIVRELARPDQFVTTCMALKRPAFDPRELNRSLDIAAVNPYYPMQDALTMPEPPPDAPQLEWETHSGVWAIHYQADLARAALRQPFLVTETNALSIGASHGNFPAFDGQWRQAAWALVARGARMIEYWHWHSIHYGHEQFWLGVLNHDGEPGRAYAEVQRIAAEFKQAGAAVVGLEPTADVALLYSRESKWAMEFHPPLATAAGAADRSSYERIFSRFYEGLFTAGVQTEILFAQDFDGTEHPVLIVPGLYVADDALLDRLAAYAHDGGHLVLSFRGGYADHEARPRTTKQPGRLFEAVGATYDEYTNLTAPVRCSGDFTGAATAWADALQPTTAETLAYYEHPHLGRWPAITTHEHGKGRVTYVGTLPDRELAVGLARWLRPNPDVFADRPKTVTVTSGRAPEGGLVRFVANWSWEQARLALPVAMTDVLNGTDLAFGEELHLGAWDVRVLLERPRKKDDEEGRPLA